MAESHRMLLNTKDAALTIGAGATMRSTGMRPLELTDRTEKRKRKNQHV